MKSLKALALLLLAPLSFGAEFSWDREECPDGSTHRLGYCPPVVTVNATSSIDTTSATANLSTTQGGGVAGSTMWCYATTGAAPAATTIKTFGTPVTVNAVGAVSCPVTGLTEATPGYTVYAVHEWEERDSQVASGGSFSTIGGGGGGGPSSFDYAGIPYPTDPLPAAIYPTLPTPANTINGWPYDPIATPTPVWSGDTGEYYIDGSDPGCSDASNGGFGTETNPRCTIPGLSTGGNGSWTLSAGVKLFIAGGTSYGGQNDVQDANLVGTASQPIWIIGVGAQPATLLLERFFPGSSGGIRHVFMDNIRFYSADDRFRMITSNGDSASYFTFRNGVCEGSEGIERVSPSSRCFFLGGSSENISQFIMLYNNKIFGLGRWQDDYSTSRDLLGVQVNPWARYVWILNNEIYHHQGDAIMCGNGANSGGWTQNGSDRPHYVFIGGNTLYETYENGFDQKGCMHMVFSDNYVHDFYNSQVGANGTAIIVEQDSESQYGGEFNFFFRNRVENAGIAFRASTTTEKGDIAVIGNYVKNANDVLHMLQRCYNQAPAQKGAPFAPCPDAFEFALNTVQCAPGGTAVDNRQGPPPSDHLTNLDGNIILGCDNDSRAGGDGSPIAFESGIVSSTLNIRGNILFTSGTTLNEGLQSSRADVYSGNVFNQDPLLGDFDNLDISLGVGSPAIDAVQQIPRGLTRFLSLYPPSMTTGLLDKILGPDQTVPINAGANPANFGN